MKNGYSTALFAYLACGIATQVTAQQGSNQPLDLQADHIEIQDKAQKAIFAGNVRGKQGDLNISANRATASYTGQTMGGGGNPQIQRIDASGDVIVTRPTETTKGNFAIYDFNKRTIVMLGNVTLTRQGAEVHGGRLTLNLNTNRAVMDGSSVSGSGIPSNGGRVHGIFTVPKRTSTSDNVESSTPSK